ncbi:MAG TPA: hypothetical protein VMU25_00850 [Candidatus Paceibacterota bacterium]|nr:hypothetical protein [Candidatus Paceibacterota bacterium]
MPRKNALIVAVIVVVAVIGTTLLVASFLNNGASQEIQKGEVSSLVTSFGKQLQKVSVLSPDASSTMATVYGAYASPQLLHDWQKNPATAPGRTTSSPWPDHIDITSINPQGSGFIVNGNIVLMTSNETAHGGNAGLIPVVMLILNQNGKWQIVAYQEQRGNVH